MSAWIYILFKKYYLHYIFKKINYLKKLLLTNTASLQIFFIVMFKIDLFLDLEWQNKFWF